MSEMPRIHLGRDLRMKAIKEALTELVTGTLAPWDCEARLKAYGCDESEAKALISSAPKTMVKRRKPRFKGDRLPLSGGSGGGLTK